MQASVPLPPGATRNDCPFCDTNDWELFPRRLGMRILPILKAKPRYATMRILWCKRCGFLRFQGPGSFNRQAPADSGSSSSGPTEEDATE